MRSLHRYHDRILGLGAALGLLLAAPGAFVAPSADLSAHGVARVSGKEIIRHELDLAVARTSGPRATTHAQRRSALEFLIDQELLIQRGVSIGVLDSDRTVRKALAMALIDRTVAEVLKHEPSEEALQTFYASHRAIFSLPGRLRVQQLTFSATGDSASAHTQAERAVTALRDGMGFAEARQRFGQQLGAPLPDALLPPHVLHRHLGPSLTHAALALKAGEVSAPVAASPLGYHVLRMAERQDERVRPYQEVRSQVRAEYLRRERDRAAGMGAVGF